MSKAVNEIKKIYKSLIEKELRDICEMVIERGTFSYFGHKYIYYDAFKKVGKEYISAKELPVDDDFIDNFLQEITRDKHLENIGNANFAARYINFFNKHLFESVSTYIKANNKERTYDISCLKNLLNFLTLRLTSVFSEFAKLKTLLDNLGISAQIQLEIFIEIIEANYRCFSQKEFYVFKPDYEEMLKHRFRHLSKEQITDIVKNNRIEKFLNEDNPQAEKAQDELREYMQANCVDVTDLQNNCILLVQTIRKNPRTEEDNAVIAECMKNLYFPDLTHRLIKYLNHEEEKKMSSLLESRKREMKKDNISRTNKESENVPMPKKQTSLNQTLREIGTYYAIDDKKLKETLSMDKIIYVLSLMYSINMEKDSIDAFLRSAMREFKNMHPYAIYNQAYDKFAFLGENDAEIKEHLEMIEYILSDTSMFICDEEEYIETKRLVEEELSEIMQAINGNFTYEIEEAKKLLK